VPDTASLRLSTPYSDQPAHRLPHCALGPVIITRVSGSVLLSGAVNALSLSVQPAWKATGAS
jgi:hypothetical protein